MNILLSASFSTIPYKFQYGIRCEDLSQHKSNCLRLYPSRRLALYRRHNSCLDNDHEFPILYFQHHFVNKIVLTLGHNFIVCFLTPIFYLLSIFCLFGLFGVVSRLRFLIYSNRFVLDVPNIRAIADLDTPYPSSSMILSLCSSRTDF